MQLRLIAITTASTISMASCAIYTIDRTYYAPSAERAVLGQTLVCGNGVKDVIYLKQDMVNVRIKTALKPTTSLYMAIYSDLGLPAINPEKIEIIDTKGNIVSPLSSRVTQQKEAVPGDGIFVKHVVAQRLNIALPLDASAISEFRVSFNEGAVLMSGKRISFQPVSFKLAEGKDLFFGALNGC